jgi:hypothetical protein
MADEYALYLYIVLVLDTLCQYPHLNHTPTHLHTITPHPPHHTTPQTLLGEGEGGVETAPVMVWKSSNPLTPPGSQLRSAEYLLSLNVPRTEYVEW